MLKTQTKAWKKAFARGYAKAFADEICRKISDGTVPREWDGHELRVWMADRMMADSRCSTIRKNPRSRRAREYRGALYSNGI